MLWTNVERRINAAARLLEHASISGVGNIAKSSYYRSASILLCTVVEGMVYELVKKNTNPPKHIIFNAKRYVEKVKIPPNILKDSGDHFICEKTDEEISIDDKGSDFGKLNLYLKNNGIVTGSEYKNLNWVRNERNKVHLQGLNTPDTGYTQAKIEKIGNLISFLEKKIS